MKRLAGLFLLSLGIAGCAAYQLDTAQKDLRTSFASGDYASTATLIQTLDKNQVYKSKDEVLLYLESGMVNHFAGNYKQSSQYFTKAEYRIEDLYTKSLSRALQSFLVNDNSLAYDGEDYEDIYLNIFKGLNYIHLNDLQGALVEVRRVSYKLTQLDQKYNGLINALSKADTTSTGSDKWKTGEANIQNSALGRYLSTILFAKTQKPDDARIEYENLVKAYQQNPLVYNFDPPSAGELERLTQPQSYNVMVQAFSGRAPIKIQNDTRLYLDETDTYLKFSFPSLQTFASKVHAINLVIDSSAIVPINLIEEMDKVAKEVYKVKEPIIYARTVVRTFLKAAAANKLKREATKQDETLGQLVNLLGKVAQEATEKADLRSWQTMPGKAYGTVLKLAPGDHTLIIKYYGAGRRLIHTDRKMITIGENENLALVESIYWN